MAGRIPNGFETVTDMWVRLHTRIQYMWEMLCWCMILNQKVLEGHLNQSTCSQDGHVRDAILKVASPGKEATH